MATEYVWQLGKEEMIAGDEIVLEFNMLDISNHALDLSSSMFTFALTPIGRNLQAVLQKTGESQGVYITVNYSEGAATSCIVRVNLFYEDTINLDGQYIMYISIQDYKGKKHSPAMGYLTIYSSPNLLQSSVLLRSENISDN